MPFLCAEIHGNSSTKRSICSSTNAFITAKKSHTSFNESNTKIFAAFRFAQLATIMVRGTLTCNFASFLMPPVRLMAGACVFTMA